MWLTAILIQQRLTGKMKILPDPEQEMLHTARGLCTQPGCTNMANPETHTVLLWNHPLVPASHPCSCPSPIVKEKIKWLYGTGMEEVGKVREAGRESQYKLYKGPDHWVDKGLPSSQVSEEETDSVRCYVITDLCPQWSKFSCSWLAFQLQVYTRIRMSSRFLRASCGDDSKNQETRAVREKVRRVTTLVAWGRTQAWDDAKSTRWYQQ